MYIHIILYLYNTANTTIQVVAFLDLPNSVPRGIPSRHGVQYEVMV